jgi:zinc protease
VEQEQAALEIGTMLDQGFDPGLAWIFAVVPPGGDVARTEQLIDAELERIARDGPTPAELAKARNQALASFWHGLETISGKAQALGTYEVFHGDYHRLFEAPQVYENITAEDVRTAASSVLRSENRTVGILEPVPASPEPDPQARP